jgi:hypothetical protein
MTGMLERSEDTEKNDFRKIGARYILDKKESWNSRALLQRMFK